LLSSIRFGQRAALAIVVATPLLADLASIRGLIRSGQFPEAIGECDRELKATPRSFSLYTMKGLALQSAGDKAAGLAAFRQALAINPAYEPALQAAAQIEFEDRDSNAKNTLESVLRVSPSSETAHVMLAVLLFENRSCESALAHFEKAPGALQSPSVKWQYGVCLLERQRWSDAVTQFASLLQLREHAPTRYNLALAYWNAKDYQAAVSTLQPLDGPYADADVKRLLANSLEAIGDTPKAYAVLQRAIEQNPQDERFLVDFAVMCMDHKALDLGLDAVRAGIRNLPGSARLQTILGVLLVRSGDTASGQEAFRRAQELEPEAGLGRIGLASTLMQMGLAADAVTILREQLAESGRDPRTELTLVRALLMKGPSAEENLEAVRDLQWIVKEEPGSAAARGLLGKLYFQLGDLSRATAELESAIRLDPSDRASTYQLMRVFQRTGRAKEASELSRKVQTLLEKEKTDEAAGNRFQIVRENEIGAANRE
jgi:tetratricopeptide (TPR) repeat protein